MKAHLPSNTRYATRHFAFLCLFLFAPLTLGHAEVKYEEERGAEYAPQEDAYQDRQEVDEPPRGWYRSQLDYPIPEDWPEWVVRQWDSLIGETPEAYSRLHKWVVPKLRSNRQWQDPKASRVKNPLKLECPKKGAYFTVLKADPANITVEQDFKGNAVVYNADDTVRYTFKAYTESGYVGKFATAMVDKGVSLVRLGAYSPDPPENCSEIIRGIDDVAIGELEPNFIMLTNPTFYRHGYGALKRHRLAGYTYGGQGTLFWYELGGGDYGYPCSGVEEVWAFAGSYRVRDYVISNLSYHADRGGAAVPLFKSVTYVYDSRFNELASRSVGTNSGLPDPDTCPPCPSLGWHWGSPRDFFIAASQGEDGFVFVGATDGLNLTACDDSDPPCTWTLADTEWRSAFGKMDSSLSLQDWGNGNDYDDDFIANGDDDMVLHKVIVDDSDDYVVLGYKEFSNGANLNAPLVDSDSWILKFEGATGANEGDRLWKANHANHLLYDIVDVGGWYLAVGRYETNSNACVVKISKADGSIISTIEYDDFEYFYSINRAINNTGCIVAGYGEDAGVRFGALVKVGDGGTKEWSKSYTPNAAFNTEFTDAKETRDYGFLAVGYHHDTVENRRYEYIVKTNRNGDTCSDGIPCD